MLAALPAHASAVLCTDAAGRSYRLSQAPDPAYTFFVHCTARPGLASMAVEAPNRTRELQRMRQRQTAIVIWPTYGAGWAPRNDAGAARLTAALPLTTRAQAHLPLIQRVASAYELDPHYLQAMMRVESGFNTHAVSPKGATGLMQIMPATARRFGVEDPQRQLRDPATNVETAARYLKFLQREFNGDWTLVTAAYNAGEGAVRKYGNRVPPYNETVNYVRSVEQHFDAYRRAQGVE